MARFVTVPDVYHSDRAVKERPNRLTPLPAGARSLAGALNAHAFEITGLPPFAVLADKTPSPPRQKTRRGDHLPVWYPVRLRWLEIGRLGGTSRPSV